MGENFVCYLIICTIHNQHTRIFDYFFHRQLLLFWISDIIVIVNRRRNRDTRHDNDNDDENRIFYGCWMLSTRMNRESLFQKRERRWTVDTNNLTNPRPNNRQTANTTSTRGWGWLGLITSFQKTKYTRIGCFSVFLLPFTFSYFFSFLLHIIFLLFHKDIFKSYLLLHYKNKLLLCG